MEYLAPMGHTIAIPPGVLGTVERGIRGADEIFLVSHVRRTSASDTKTDGNVDHLLRRPLIGKANHLTGHLSAKQGRKRFVDLFQRDLTRDHLIEFQLAVQIHINIAWHIDTKTVRAHTRTLNFFLLQEVRRSVQ